MPRREDKPRLAPVEGRSPEVPRAPRKRQSILPPPIADRIAGQPRNDVGEIADVVLRLALPLPPRARKPFMEAVAATLAAQGRDGIGPGAAHRVASEIQGEFLRAPTRGPLPRRLKMTAAESQAESMGDFGNARACVADTAGAK
jgi:hypothetical protein